MTGKVVLLVFLLSTMILTASAQSVTWTDSFVQGQTPTAQQCQNWNAFRAQLGQKSFASVTISGTYDEVGRTITDPVSATVLAQLLSSGTSGTVNSGGHTWSVGMCGASLCGGLSVTLSVDGSSSACECTDTYAIRANAQGDQWGGINTASCNAPSQTMRLVFHSGVSIITSGSTTLCPGDSVVLTADAQICTGPYTYLWSNGATTESIAVSEAGSYSVTATSSDGCSATSSAIPVSVTPISVDAGEAATFCSEPVQLSATGISGGGGGGVVNKFCMFDAQGGNCSFESNQDLCNAGAFYYTSGSFNTTVSVSNPTELRYHIYYSAFSESTSFVLKLNDIQIGTFTESPADATGACDTRGEGKFPRTFTFSASQFIQYWNTGGDNVLGVEVVSGIPGVYLGAVSAEVVSANESYSWSPADGLSNASIQNPLASPGATTIYTVTYTDGNGCTATDQVEVTVNCDTAPVAVCQPVSVEAGENCEAIVEASAFDGGSTSNTGGQLTFSVSPAGPFPVGETEIILTVTDPIGGSSTCTTTVTVTDTIPPVITAPDILVSNDDGTCTATITLEQPEATDYCGMQSISNDQADDIFPVGETIVTWTATDIHGNQQTATQKVIVANSEPAIYSVSASPSMVEINSPVTLNVGYTDNNIRNASVDWGDLSAPEVVESPADSFDITHAYSGAGTYVITITLTDECDATSSYRYESITVIEKLAGSVSGNGWFHSLPGFYLKKPGAAGKAQFEFRAQYAKNGTMLFGKASFKFHEGRLHFRSTGFDLLRIDGENAFLTGTGKVNGKSGYGILISMVDRNKKEGDQHRSDDDHGRRGGGHHSKKGDRIRVKIWDADGAVVYDTQLGSADDAVATTRLGGGEIKINSKHSSAGEWMEDVIASHSGRNNVSVYPNPFMDWIEVDFASSSQENVHIQLMDLNGQVIYSAHLPVSENGSYAFDMPEKEKRRGIFILKINQGRNVEFVRLVRE